MKKECNTMCEKGSRCQCQGQKIVFQIKPQVIDDSTVKAIADALKRNTSIARNLVGR